jgi:ribonuclease BN (tRNA processing enzyme)
MRLTVIGCAGSYPNATSPASCYLVEHDGHRVLLDLGNGALGALQRHVALDWPVALDAVILSHGHVDHCVDTASLYVQRHYAPTRTTERLAVWGPSDARSRIAAIYGMADAAPLDEEFSFGLLGGTVVIGPITVTSAPAVHPVEAYSIRIEAAGRTLVYSGDTGPHEGLVELSRGADLAVFEASFVGTGNPPDVHMSGADAGRMAQRAGVSALLLTHLVAWNDDAAVLAEARAAFDGPVALAVPDMVVDV